MSVEKAKIKEGSRPKYKERTGELTENEKLVLDNLRGTAKWLENYEATCFGIDENVVDKNPKLAEYLKEFQREFSSFEGPSEAQEVEAEAKKADIVFLGDHHNLRRNQEFSAKFIEKALEAESGEKVLVLEFIFPKYQKALEEFVSGETDEETFLKKSYFLEWTDADHWPGYRKILETARKSGIKVYGIRFNAKNATRDLGDKFFAEKLAGISKEHPQAKLFVHIGNAHLADGHLPKILSQTEQFQNKKRVVILQNIRPLYFSALERYENFEMPKVLKVKDGVYNFITAPLLTEVVSDIENLKQFTGVTEGEEDVWADVLGAEIVSQLRKMTGIGVDDRVADSKDYPPSFFFPSFYSENESAALLKQAKEELSSAIYAERLKTLDEKGCVYLAIPRTDRDFSNPAHTIVIRKFRLKRIIEELAKFVIDPKGERGDISALQYFCSKLFIPERQPENPKEKAGEKMFKDFLKGKMPALPH